MRFGAGTINWHFLPDKKAFDSSGYGRVRAAEINLTNERKRQMTITKFLDPKNDVAFKKIFGTKKNKDILIHFLNDMVVFKGNKPIVDVSFLKTMQDPEISSKKTSLIYRTASK